MRKQVGIVVFNNIEVLDFCGPYEVFSVTRSDESKRREELSPFEVMLVAETNDVITAQGGLRVLPDYALENCPALDILVVPGGWGTRREIHNTPLIEWISKRGREVEVLTSVCTGAVLLGQAGLLDGHKATTHWAAISWMRELFPNVKVDAEHHVVKDGHIFTSAGISAGIDMALHVVAHYFGESIALTTARHMEYIWSQDNARHI